MAENPKRWKLRLTLGLSAFGGVAAATSFTQRVGDLIGWTILGALVLLALFAVLRAIVGEVEINRECRRSHPPTPVQTPRYHPRHDHRPVPDND